MTARTIDKPTSHKAAGKITHRLPALRQLLVSTAKRRRRPLTANELASFACTATPIASHESLRKRVRECVDAGTLQECNARKCQVTGHKATTYKAV